MAIHVAALGMSASYPRLHLAALFGLSTSQALVVLFVLLPFALAAVIVPLVAWRSSRGPRPILTSEILARGTAAEAEVLSVRSLGTIVDVRPMVRFSLMVKAAPGGDPFEMEVVQSIPRALVRDFRPGAVVEVRVLEDRSAAAIVVGGSAPGRGGAR